MDVATESFSIREYAEKMRRIDMGKCWPFSCEGRERIVRSLPPILLRKFRWWVDELESEGVNENQAPASQAEEDTCPTPARFSGRGKQKVPKKRSIVELFAVAPQIEAVEEDDDGEAEDREGLGEGGREEVLGRGKGNVYFDSDGEVQERNNGRRALIRRNQIRLKSIKKQKKKKKIITSTKVKSHTSKLPSSGAISPISEYYSRKTKLKDPIGEHTEKESSQVLKTVTPKFSGKKHDDVRKFSPLRSILKNRISTKKKIAVMSSKLRGHHMKSCGKLVKEVSFSDKDDILRPNKSAASMELPQLQTFCEVLFSDVVPASTAIDNSSKGEKPSAVIERPRVEKENMDVSASAIQWADRPGSENNHSSECYGHTASIIDPSSSNCLDKDQNNSIEIFDLNKNMQMHSNLSCPKASDSTSLHCHQDSSNRQTVDSIYNEDLFSNSRNHIHQSISSASDNSSYSFPCRTSVPRSDSTCSQTVIRNPVMQPSSSCMLRTIRNDNDISQPSSMFDRPACCLCSKHFSSSNCSPVGSMKLMEPIQASDTMFFSSEKITNEDFIGLPLNSHGELVKFDSSCKFGFNNPFKKNNTVPDSFRGSLVPTYMEPMRRIPQEKMKEKFHSRSLYAEDLFQVLPNQYLGSENQLTSGQEIAELQKGMEAENLEPVQSKAYYNVPCSGRDLQNCACQTDRLTSHPGMRCRINGGPQPTMRLMGTTVTIGEISKECQSFDDGKVWIDKQITVEQCPRESVSLGTYSDQRPRQEMFPHSPLWASQANHSPQACLRLTQQPLVHCNSARESIESIHHKPEVTSLPCDISHQWLLDSTHCKQTQSLSSSKPLANNPLFRHNTPGCFAEPSSICSSPYHPQRLLNAKEPLKSQIVPFICYPAPFAGYHPCTMAGTNLLDHHLLDTIQLSRAQNRDEPKSKITYLKAWNQDHKRKKRLAEKGGEFIRPSKKANVILPVSILGPEGRSKQNIFRPSNIGNTGILHHEKETRNPHTEFLGYKNDEYRCFFESSSKYDRGMISEHAQFCRGEKDILDQSRSRPIYSSGVGPVKLRAGAKHVLEPCRKSDRKSCGLIHSTIPLVDGNASSRIVVSHKKLEEIYSF